MHFARDLPIPTPVRRSRRTSRLHRAEAGRSLASLAPRAQPHAGGSRSGWPPKGEEPEVSCLHRRARRAVAKGGAMLGGLSVDELIELRLDLHYAAQKTLGAVDAVLCQRQREKNSSHYTADQLKEGKLAVEHAHTMLRGSAKKMLPELNALAEEGFPT